MLEGVKRIESPSLHTLKSPRTIYTNTNQGTFMFHVYSYFAVLFKVLYMCMYITLVLFTVLCIGV